MKVSVNDQSLAEREESIERLRLLVAEGDRKIKLALTQLEESNMRTKELKDTEKEFIDKERENKLEISKLRVSLKNTEEYLDRSDMNKTQWEQENIRTQSKLEEQEEQIQACHARMARL